MTITWQTLEDTVRSIASLKWGCVATPQHLGGIDFDAVLRPSSDELILIEITKQHTLRKVRDDIVKINALRLQSLSDGVLCRGYVLLEKEPTTSMVETGISNKVQVLSVGHFLNLYFNADTYFNVRRAQPFGSALNPFTGSIDETEYIPVRYSSEDKHTNCSVANVCDSLLRGEKLILIGDYGTGKSRCIKQVFELLQASSAITRRHVFAINLREHWGASSASEIIAGHLEELGLSGQIDNAMQIINGGGAILLLDGLDEVGAQVFGSTKDSRQSLRRAALEGVRKLVQKNIGGVLITTRSHYFDTDEEMLSSTGLTSGSNVNVLRCPDEFSEDEALEYLSKININSSLPPWIPRKPLVFQVLSTLECEAAKTVLESDDGEFSFWGKFINAVCEREARIHGSLQADAIRQILIALAEATREGNEFLGRLSIRAVREAYEKVIHDTPDQAGEQMLMRLCTLGRVSPETPERQFVDNYIVDGLRAEALIFAIDQQSREIGGKVWKQPLHRFGWYLLLESFVQFDKEGLFRDTLASLTKWQNSQAYSEVLSVILATEGSPIDCKNFFITDADIYWLRIGLRQVTNLFVKSTYIQNLEILPEAESQQSTLQLNDCQVIDLYGVSGETGMPKWIVKTDVERFDNMTTASRIQKSDLSQSLVLFLSIVHKIFFQPGSGREERSLFKGGFGQKYDPQMINKIVAILYREKIIGKIKGDDGFVYTPNRKHTRRMAAIKAQLALSGDPLWAEIAQLT